jgi:GntR family transcriptional repressor for pyruvate dehydrogenase complex
MPPPAAAAAPASETDLAVALLRPVRGANAFESTVERLATAIRLGVFADGDRLPPERELAASMRVSRATLREAIAALREAGLVRTRSGRGGGTEVTHGAPAENDEHLRSRRLAAREVVEADLGRYRDSLTVRRIVEPGAAYAAAEQDLTADRCSWLREALAEVSAETDPTLHRQADSRFHLAIATLSGSPRLLDLVTEVQRDLHHMLTAIPVLAVNISHSNDEHQRIANAILAGRPDDARHVMEIHCDGSAALLRGLLGIHEPSPRRDGTPA